MEDALSFITETYLAAASAASATPGKSYKMVRLSGNYARICGTANGAVHGVLLNEPAATRDAARILLFGKALIRSGESRLLAGETFVTDNTGRCVSTASTAASNTLAYFGGRLLRSNTPDVVNSLVSALIMPWQGFL